MGINEFVFCLLLYLFPEDGQVISPLLLLFYKAGILPSLVHFKGTAEWKLEERKPRKERSQQMYKMGEGKTIYFYARLV